MGVETELSNGRFPGSRCSYESCLDPWPPPSTWRSTCLTRAVPRADRTTRSGPGGDKGRRDQPPVDCFRKSVSRISKQLGVDPVQFFSARIRCDTCRHEYLLAFSFKGRYFCRSCHQKRVLQFGGWMAEEVSAAVPHRQYVFAVPKILRVYFRKDRRLLGKLSQCAAAALKTLFRSAGRVVRDVVDEVNLLRFRPRDSFFDPGRRHAELVRRIGEGEPALRYQVRREGGPDGRPVAPARHRRSAMLAGWISLAPPLFHFVSIGPHYRKHQGALGEAFSAAPPIHRSQKQRPQSGATAERSAGSPAPVGQ